MSERGNAVELTLITPKTWDGTDSYTNLIHFDTIEFQLVNAQGGPWTPVRRMDSTAVWDACIVYDQFGNPYTQITTSMVGKILKAPGRANFMLTPTLSTDTLSAFVRAA